MVRGFILILFLIYCRDYCILGGVVYIAISAGAPFAGFLLRNFDHKIVIISAILANALLTLLWSLTPINMMLSRSLFISLRFCMGLAQCILSVFLPFWINEFAPDNRRTSWMGLLQVY